MEIPLAFKELYRHWKYHTAEHAVKTLDETPRKIKTVTGSDAFCNTALFAEIKAFIDERMSIWKNKMAGMHPPYTGDPILAQYRFCNIFREFDRQTVEFHSMLAPLRDDFPLWLLNMFYCRMVARPETVNEVGLLSFDKKENEKFYKRFMESSRPRFGTPYVFPVSTIQKSIAPTRELFIARHLPSVMEKIAEEVSGWNKESVSEGVEKIIPFFKFNHRFLWTEVLIDVAYQYPDRINLFAEFPIGPGSRPTMERIAAEIETGAAKGHGDMPIDIESLPLLLVKLPVETGLTFGGAPIRLSAENWEGIGCEFRKYTNLKTGKGRKRLYNKNVDPDLVRP